MHKSETVWKLIAKKPCAALTAALIVMIQAVINVSEVIILEHFIDNFSNLHWMQCAFFAGVIAAIYAFYYIQTPLLGYLNDKICIQLRIHLERAVVGKTARISMTALEDADHQALLARLRDEPEKRYAQGFFSVLQILGGTAGTVGILMLIINNAPFYLLVIFLLLGLMVLVFRLIGKSKAAMYQTRQEISRRSDYLSGLLFDRHLAQEKKLFGYTHFIQKLYEEETIQSGRQLIRSVLISNMILWVYDNITFLFSASAYLVLLVPLYRGEIDIGLYLAVIPALARLGAFFVEVGSKHYPAYQEYRACLADLEKLNALPEQYYVHEEENSVPPDFHVIKGENIVFRYPGQKEPILNGLNFTFQAGKNYALVGENGCGKSTLIKLLMGFYQPDSGSITIDGVNIQELGFAKVQQYFSAVFQDFNRYDYTIKENIFISSLEKESPGDAIHRAAREAEMDTWILSNPDVYDTKLGDLEDGGIDLSGGQWQRLAIARMLYRKAGIYIWDEPAAAMDPLVESRLYADFLHKRSEQCANIFVTHRLGAAVKADEICVLENGRFVEQGNHAQLLQKKDGLYRRMFQAQKGMYE